MHFDHFLLPTSSIHCLSCPSEILGLNSKIAELLPSIKKWHMFLVCWVSPRMHVSMFSKNWWFWILGRIIETQSAANIGTKNEFSSNLVYAARFCVLEGRILVLQVVVGAGNISFVSSVKVGWVCKIAYSQIPLWPRP